MTIELNEENFQAEVIQSGVPVLVDFWAERCGPCVMLAPVLEQVAAEVAGKAKVCKMDAGTYRQHATRYGVRAVPNLLFFKNGEVREQIIGGNVTKAQLLAKLQALC